MDCIKTQIHNEVFSSLTYYPLERIWVVSRPKSISFSLNMMDSSYIKKWRRLCREVPNSEGNWTNILCLDPEQMDYHFNEANNFLDQFRQILV
jgi:hypothetical protein